MMSLLLSACASNGTTLEYQADNTNPAPWQAVTPTLTSVTPHLALEMLRNAEYHSEIAKTFRLVDGVYYLTPMPGESPDDWYIRIDEPMAFGDINADELEDAVVTLKSRSGGTGVIRCLAAVVNQNGQPYNAATRCLGDRERVESLTIQAGTIIVEVLTHGPSDGSCCPSLRAIRKYRLAEDELIQVSE